MEQIANYPADAYLRVFHADRDLSEAEVAELSQAIEGFLPGWDCENGAIVATYSILHNRFAVIAVDEGKTMLSGCAKDSLVGVFREFGAKHNVDLVHAPPLCYRSEAGIQAVDRAEFGERVERGEIKPDTTVFDQTVHSVGAFRDGRWELAAKDCWHGQAYDLV